VDPDGRIIVSDDGCIVNSDDDDDGCTVKSIVSYNDDEDLGSTCLPCTAVEYFQEQSTVQQPTPAKEVEGPNNQLPHSIEHYQTSYSNLSTHALRFTAIDDPTLWQQLSRG
ncbi:hypothetical protein AKJ16_DCAP04879, partial [Drosera capensis]